MKDTGIGMPEEFIERIFNPFEQESSEMARNNVGSGLGLTIAYNLIQMMNGTVTVKSEKDKGTEFNVTIPLELVCDNKQKARERKSRELMWGLEVLAVDDDPVVGEQIAVEKYQSSPEGSCLAVPMDGYTNAGHGRTGGNKSHSKLRQKGSSGNTCYYHVGQCL